MKFTGRPIKDYDNAIKNAHLWLKSQQKPNGLVEEDIPLWGYYTQPFAFHAMGDPVSANRCLNFIKNRFLKEGGFLQHEAKGVGSTYAPAWTVVSSHLWERFDISYPVSEWILRFQDQRSGGFFETEDDVKNGTGRIEFDATTISGIALITVGKLKAAEKVGEYILKLHKEQPDIDNRYLFVWETGKGLVDDYNENEAQLYAMIKGKEKQAYWKSGLLISLMTNLFSATGKKAYLNVAKEHFDFAVNCHDDLWQTAFAHKLCWGSAILYQATGEYRFLEASKKIGDHIISLQQEDGRYHYRDIFKKFEEQELTPNLDIVSQFTSWISRTRWFMNN